MKNKFKYPVLAACIVAFLVAANAGLSLCLYLYPSRKYAELKFWATAGIARTDIASDNIIFLIRYSLLIY